jgi:Zn-dependent peptidase ImmA (M78 family)
MTVPSSPKLLRQRAEYHAREVIVADGISRFPVDPIRIATKRGITVSAKRVKNAGVSGCLMKVGDEFGIGYTTHIDNPGFINFTIAHELGHYFLPGHIGHLFSDGDQVHLSYAGFVSRDNYEKEADFFAAALLMPSDLFTAALQTAGDGFAAITVLANKCQASLTATAIRYSQLSDLPVAVVLSSKNQVECCFVSEVLTGIRGVIPLRKGDPVPDRTPTARFNQDVLNHQTRNCDTATSLLSDWFEGAPGVEFNEDVVGLGKYGKTLTVLFASEIPNEDDASDDEDTDISLPSSRWRARHLSRDS